MCYTFYTMLSHWKKTFVLYSLLSFLSSTASVFAESEAVFNANYLISDEELQDSNSMTRADIQAFLLEKGGYISNFQAEDKEGMRRTTSDIISRAAQEHNINPKYLLVKLQKEQSLVTDPDPTQKQLDWATGYGVCDSCKMTDPDIQKHKGFGVQVDSAAAIMRWYYDHVNQEPWIKQALQTYMIDGQSIKPANLATAFLYTYTPHIHGNQNFWNLWQRWFEQVYPNGSLLKSTDETTVYLIQDGKKRPFASFSALITRFDPKYIITVPTSELARYESSNPVTFANYSILKAGSKFYLLDYDTLRPFENEAVVKSLGYNPDEIIDVNASDVEEFTVGKTITAETKTAPLGELLRIKENNKLYFLDEGILHPISDQHIATANFPHLKEHVVAIASLPAATMGIPITFKDGTLIQVQGENKVYVVEKAKKRHISSEAVFNGLGYKWENIIVTDEFTGLNHPTGEPLYLRKDGLATEPNANLASGTTPLPTTSDSATTQKSVTNVPQPSIGVMISVPEEKSAYVGEIFTTEMNTYLVMDYATGKVLAGKNIDVLRPAASFTKVMTGYRLMQEGVHLSDTTTFNPTEHTSLYPLFRITAGEKILNKDLLDALLVSSLNPPAKMLVDSVEPDEDLFIKGMNEQAQAWGLTQTRFTDVAGERPDSVTTAREYATLFVQALKDSTLASVLEKKSYSYTELTDVDGKPNHFDTHSNELTQKTGLPFIIHASKTGYLDEAGAGLAMVIERADDQQQFLVITMGNPDYPHRFDGPEQLARWAIKQF